jgi:hypothetical protein
MDVTQAAAARWGAETGGQRIRTKTRNMLQENGVQLCKSFEFRACQAAFR